MRTPFLLLPLAAVLSAPLAATAQDNPRVLFCGGECFIVDQKGVRTPAPKGTEVPPGFRVVTGPGGYVQVKLSPDSAIGLGENANAVLQRAHIVLEQGRMRLVGGEALGRPSTRPIELRTNDGTFTLRNADVEMRAMPGTTAPTLVKVNAGDALVGSTVLARNSVQAITTGRITTAPTLTVTEVTPPTRIATLDRSTSLTTLTFQPTSFTTTTTYTKLDTISRLDTTTSLTTFSRQLTSPEKFLRSTATDSTGQTLSVSDALKDVTATNKIQSVTVVSPTVTTDKTAQIYDTGTKIYTIPTTSTKSVCLFRRC